MADYFTFTLLASLTCLGILPYFIVAPLPKPHELLPAAGKADKFPYPKTNVLQYERESAIQRRRHRGLGRQGNSGPSRETDSDGVGHLRSNTNPTWKERPTIANVDWNVHADHDISFTQRSNQRQNDHISIMDAVDDSVTRNVIESRCSKRRTSIAGDKCCKVKNRHANCSHCNLARVPTDLSVDIISLDLSYNCLDNDSLATKVFGCYSKLTALDLTFNKIKNIPEGAFRGLSQLQHLNLCHNQIKMNRDLNDSKVFQPLAGSLSTLLLSGNYNNTSDPDLFYPEYALSFLENLTELHLDGLMNKTFGEGFAKLENLNVLSLAGFRSGFCNLTALNKNTFENVSVIKVLNISECHLDRRFLDKETFSPLKNLTSLDITNNFGLSFRIVGNLMFGLRNNRNFKHLKMQRIGRRFEPCVVVFKDYLENFQNMSLETLEAPDNEIETIEIGALQILPATLKKINVQHNKIMFGAYFSDLSSLTSLTELTVDGYFDRSENFPSSLPSPEVSFCHDEEMPTRRNVNENILPHSNHLTLSLPPKLEKLSMTYNSIAYNIGELHFKNNSLKEVNLRGNVFKELLGPVIGLDSLQKLDLSECFMGKIENKFLKHFRSLEYLNLYQNLLGQSFKSDLSGHTFSSMSALRYLNLSFNNIFYIYKNFFNGTPNLEKLDLSTNRLHAIAFDISKMPNLTYLNISENAILSLRSSAMNHIDSILKSGLTFILDLRFNPIVCDCGNLPFLTWLATREKEVLYGDLSDYVCIFPDSSRINMSKGYGPIVSHLERQCGDNQLLFLFVSIGTVAVLFILLASIAYRYRWSLRYWYHSAKMMMSSRQEERNEEFDYDAFICYARKDEDFVVEKMMPELSTKRGTSLMIHGKSFHTGCMIIDNIIIAVRRCRKTIVLVTKNMLDSKWCLYELQMARMEAINTGRNVLIFMFVENIAYADIKLDIVSYIKTNVVTGYPPDPRQHNVFWDKLARDIKKR